MKYEEFQKIAALEGIEFIESLLRLEEDRFQESQFRAGSTYEDINADFGIFPTRRAYPVYFAGDIRSPGNKIVLIGINPGYNPDKYARESAFLQERGLFDGYCNLYGDYFKNNRVAVNYYSNLGGFISRLYQIDKKSIDWDWYQKHLIALEFIPYHSVNIQGLRINDREKFSKVYFEIILKLLRMINPQRPVFINGFPSIRDFVSKNRIVYPEFNKVIEFEEHDAISVGALDKQFDFIGLPFLNRPKGGKDALVEEIRRVMPEVEWQLN